MTNRRVEGLRRGQGGWDSFANRLLKISKVLH